MEWLLVIQLFLGRDLENAEAQLWTIEFESKALCEAAIPLISSGYSATIGQLLYASETGARDAVDLFPMSAVCVQVAGDPIDAIYERYGLE